MSSSRGFVWFDNRSHQPEQTSGFYEALLGWSPTEGPPGMTMFAGDSGPWAGVSAAPNDTAGWLPYAEVPDLDAATDKATRLGATVVSPRAKGPAGSFTVVQDPGGARLALWQKG
ncbi:MAG: glyoxalase [Deltaproteobacteria bacterium]|nr:glyoxalase [Deltaproteobacteria bacterium]